jgi:methyl-accepting chemotaxis protein
MNILQNTSFRARLLLGFSVILIGITATWIIAMNSLNVIIKAKAELDIAQDAARELTNLRSDQNRLNTLLLLATISESSDQSQQHLDELAEIWSSIDQIVSEMEITLEDNTTVLPTFREVAVWKDRSRQNQMQQIEHINNEQPEAALEVYREVVQVGWETLRNHINTLETQLEKQGDVLLAQSNARVNRSNFSLTTIGIAVILIVLLIIMGTMRMITQITEDIKEGINVLGSSSSEIQATVAEISTGAAETATSISETTTTVEEIRQTSMVSGKKAKNLMENSQKASDIGERGLETSQMMIDAMAKIDKQMKNILTTITKLSEQNRSIGEITTTVSDIADQSNLLAVNAAIEAAKAGEHGRGFSVVAQEIRNLSEQSKKSTAQVKDILNEIQKSVSQAVEVINQGAQTVEEGNRTVSEDRIVVETLIDSINEATEAAVQISSSSQQQMAGMDQIVPAMENIKQASEQNVSGIRQTEEAVKSLYELGESLKNVIAKYKL